MVVFKMIATGFTKVGMSIIPGVETSPVVWFNKRLMDSRWMLQYVQSLQPKAR